LETLYLADKVLPDAGREFAPGAVLVRDDRIAWVGPAKEAPLAARRVKLEKAVLVPGLVNAHSHLDLSAARDRVPFTGDFAAWLEAVVALRGEKGIEAAARAAIREALSRGTTTFGDIVAMDNFDAMLAAFAETGVRARLFVEFVGFSPQAAEPTWERVQELVERRPLPPLVATGLGPHAPYSVSRELFSRALAHADAHDRLLAVHAAESMEELAFLRHGIGPLHELLERLGADDPDHEPYGGPREFVETLRLEHAPLLLVHANFLRPKDVPGGAGVVYCPTAHRFFRHPEHPVLEFLQEGVRVALGSDSAASGKTVDLLTETQSLAQARPDLESRAVFRMATEWGGRALGLECGKLEPGAPADLAAFTPPLGHEILGSPDARCLLAVVAGEVLHDAGPSRG